MEDTPIRLVLELDRDTDAPHGRLCAPDQLERPFTGWLALAAAITAATAAASAIGRADEP
jgi:hypothetical protein